MSMEVLDATGAGPVDPCPVDPFPVDPCPVDEVFWERRGFSLVPAAQTGRELVARALSAGPDPVLTGLLAGIDPFTLDPDTRVDLICAWQRLACWVEAQQQVALASVVAATIDTGLDGDAARHEVGVALRLSPNSAYDKTQRAQALTGRLADTLAALRRGDISGPQAAAIAEAVEDLDDPVAATVQTGALTEAPEQTLAETKRTLRRAVIAADPDGAAARAEKARADRRISITALDDAMAELRAALSATDAEMVWAELTARAQAEMVRRADDGLAAPGIDALRVDALVAAILGPAEPGAPTRGPSGPSRVQLRVTIDLPTLLGLTDNPAELAGHGPIPAPLGRELAGDADWIRWTTDPQTGELLDLGRRTYRPSRRLAEFIRARYPVCGWPGCNRPSTLCDLDHITADSDGGETTRDNLGPLDRQHHNGKTHGYWHYRRDPDGTGHFTSPLGKSYPIKPPWRRPDE